MLNRIIKFSLDHKLFILLAALLLMVAGVWSARHTDVDVFPDLTAPTVVVMTDAHNMAPEEVERRVTFPIESAVNGATHVRRVRSVSQQGCSFVFVEFDWGMDPYLARQIVGEKMNSYYGYKVLGVYQNAAEVAADPVAVANGLEPGDFRYEDVNGDKVIDGSDKQALGSYVPDITYGLNAAVQWRNLDFAISFYGQAGGELWNRKRALRYAAQNFNFDLAQYENRWHGEGTSNSDPSAKALMKSWNVGDSQNASYFVESANYFRLQNVALGYTFKNIEMGGYTLPSARVSLSADRPFTWFSANTFSPEVSDADGWDWQVYPLSATYTLGVQINF